MQSLRHLLSHLLAAAILACAAGTALPAHADTYSIFALTPDNKSFFGMDDSGHVVFNSGGTYFTFLNGSPAGTASTAPLFAWDYTANSCSIPPCSTTHNGRTASVTLQPDNTKELAIAAGGPAQSLLQTFDGFSGKLALNGVGDIVFDDGTQDEWYEAIDVTASPVPEPRSVLLIATGTLGLAAFALRRREIAPSA